MLSGLCLSTRSHAGKESYFNSGMFLPISIICCQGSVCPQDSILGKESYFNSSMFLPISIICCQGSVCPQDPMLGKNHTLTVVCFHPSLSYVVRALFVHKNIMLGKESYFNNSMFLPISIKILMKAFRPLCKLKIYDTIFTRDLIVK